MNMLPETSIPNQEILPKKEVTWVMSSHEQHIHSTEKEFDKWLRDNLSQQFSNDDINALVVGFKDILTNAVNYGNLQWKHPEGDPDLSQEERLKLINDHLSNSESASKDKSYD